MALHATRIEVLWVNLNKQHCLCSNLPNPFPFAILRIS